VLAPGRVSGREARRRTQCADEPGDVRRSGRCDGV